MHSHTSEHMEQENARILATVSYLTIVGWLIALCFCSHYKSTLTTFHLRQSLGLIISAAILSFVPLIGWLFLCVLAWYWLLSIVHAFKGDFYQVPWIGIYFQEHFSFI